MAERMITSVEFSEEGVTVTFGQLYPNGLAVERTFAVPRGSDYDDEIEDVERALNALIDDVTDDTGRMYPVDLDAKREDDDDDRGLGE